MSHKTTKPGLTAAMTVGRELLAAGWTVDVVDRLADGDVVREMLHPSGGIITARTGRRGEATELTLAPLSLEQVAGAIRGAGLTAPTAEAAPAPDPDDYWVRLAAELHRAAERVATLAGTGLTPARVDLSVLGAYPQDANHASADLVEAAAEAFDMKTYKSELSSNNTLHKAEETFGPLVVEILTYLPPKQSEIDRLRAELAETKAALAAQQSRSALIVGDPDDKPGEVRHIRLLGAYRANLCDAEGGKATWPSNATCEGCKTAYAKLQAAGGTA